MPKKRLLIDPSGGVSGDMFSAALISAGADDHLIRQAMLTAATHLGRAEISKRINRDDSVGLDIKLEANDSHLDAEKAVQIMEEVFQTLPVEPCYQSLGRKILDVLVTAEKKAHSSHSFFSDHKVKGHHSHKTYLHEAQDIVIDIMGAITGMQCLDLDVKAWLLNRVSVGQGMVEFSHGRLPIPAPATQIILDTYQIPWDYGPVEYELCTPTGSAILAALQIEWISDFPSEALAGLTGGRARGSKDLPIPPLKIYLK